VNEFNNKSTASIIGANFYIFQLNRNFVDILSVVNSLVVLFRFSWFKSCISSFVLTEWCVSVQTMHLEND